MESTERVRCVLCGGTPDRPPLYDLLRNDEAIEFYAGKPISDANREAIVLSAIGNALDATKQFIRFPETPRVEVLPDGRTRSHQRWTYWDEPLRFNNSDEVSLYIRNILDHPDAFFGDPLEYTRHGEADYQRKRFGMGGALLLEIGATEGFHNFYELIGLEMLSYLVVDYPDLLSQYLDMHVERSERWINSLVITDQIPAVFYGVDLAYKSGPLFSPVFLRRVVFPRIERLIAVYHKRGIPVVFHSDGNLWRIIDDLVALGIDGLNPIEVLAGMDPTELRRRYPHLVLVGGIDCSQLLPFATHQEVASVVRRTIEAVGPGYMVGSSTELHSAIPLDNIRAMVDTAREYYYD